MNIRSIFAAGLLLLAGAATARAEFINLTPAPKEMTESGGSFSLPQGMTVSAAGLSEEMTAEVEAFISAINKATGLDAATATDASAATVKVSVNSSLAAEGYNLTVTANGVAIEAATPRGLFYAFQTLKKLLPANVMAGVAEEKAYTLPCLTINDEPRSDYRGFMLDCSRHFFTVDEVKRMLDVMSYYKLNKFHWHLTDDQGWRIEMPEYPRLQTVGATAPNVQIVDMFTKTEYWLNKEYGPYFYTRDQLREVVDYAAKLHIEVIPEVDMPGHFSAVMAAYPEFSCTPDGGHSVAVTGGIYADVLNVANPAAMKFIYDVCDALVDIFPSHTIHIGGDECPTSAWQNNAECQAKYAREGLTSYRQLQSLFIKDVADYLAKYDRHLGLWNEAITENGADTEMVKQTGATIWCWVGADGAVDKAASLGLKAIYTPISKSSDTKGSFYINRSQSPNDPPANGNKVDDVKSVYNTIPFTTGALKNSPESCYGVQGTFWCERVAYRDYLEYLALPRLLAIAEIGWTPHAKKDWASFQKRMSADRELLDYNGYRYSPYWMLDKETPDTPEPDMTLAQPLKAGRYYMFVNTAEPFANEMLADNQAGTLAHTASAWNNTIWQAATVADNADKSQTVTLSNYASDKWIAAAGAVSGRLAKPVTLGESGAEVKIYRYSDASTDVMLSLGDDALWCVPADAASAAGTVRAGANNGSGVSPFQGASWQVAEVTPVSVTATDTEGNVIFTGTRGIPVGAIATEFLPELKGFELKTYDIVPTGITAVYTRTSDFITYIGRLENGIHVGITEVEVPVGSQNALNIPEIPGCTLLTPGTLETAADGTKTVTSIYSTTAHMGVARALNQVTGTIEEGKAYLIRDAHADRNAFRCETAAGTVSGAKSAANQSPLYTWTLEANKSRFKVRNLATGNYVKALERSKTAKTGSTGASFTFTWADDHWNVKGTNGMYWDGLDNLDLVGWDGGTGHPIEIYEFLGTPFYVVTVNHVDSHGTLLGTETKYAVPGQTYVLGLPFRKGYTVTGVDGTDALKNLAADATVTVTYTSDSESSISEIEAAGNADTPIYDLNGRRLSRICAPGIYIVNGQKILVK